MPSRHYDVIVLGRSIGALLCAALLSRRELRVLVLGQGELSPFYTVEEYTLCRRSFTLLAATCPTFRKILQELAQSPNFRRLTSPLNPMFALLDGDVRFTVPPDVDLFTSEINREFSEIEQPIAELYAQISSANAHIDSAFERDALWPPGTLLERMETGRLASSLPLLEATPGALLSRMPEDHSFRRVVQLPAVFSTHVGISAKDLDEFSLARLHGSWTRGVHCLTRGEKELEDFLVSRIEVHGGTVRFAGRAEELVVRRGRVVGVIEDGEQNPTATGAVVSALSGELLAELSDGAGITKRAREHWPHVAVVGARFVMSLIVDDKALPAPLPKEAFLVGRTPDLPDLHLQRFDTAVMTAPAPGEGRRSSVPRTTLLVAEMILPKMSGVHLLGAREAILAALCSYFPFLDEHLLLVDSPYDGLPVWRYERNGRGENIRKELERIHIKGTSVHAENMRPRIQVTPPGYLKVGGEPLRGPIGGTYLVGPSVLPGLGQEGEVLAAWGVARILTKKDGVRQKMRRQMWTKIETG